MPAHLQGYPDHSGLVESLDRLLQERFSQLESRLDSRFGPNRFRDDLDLRETLIRVEEKVTSFQNFFEQVERLNKTNEAILLQLRSTNPGEVRPPTKPGGISINLLPSRTAQLEGQPSLAELSKSNVDILNLLRAIDQKVSGAGAKDLPGVNEWVSVGFASGGLELKPPSDNDKTAAGSSASDLKAFIEEKLAPVQTVSDRLDSLIKQVRDHGLNWRQQNTVEAYLLLIQEPRV